MTSLHFHLQHGWASDYRAWLPLAETLKKELSPAMEFCFHDRGYFEKRRLCRFAGERNRRQEIAICHSLGLHMIEPALLLCDYLILIDCFLEFHPREEKTRIRSRRLIRLMQKNLEIEPRKVLTDFHRQAGLDLIYAHEVSPVSLERDRLSEDLELLNESSLSPSFIKPGISCLVVHGENDRVVGKEKAEELRNAIAGKTELKLIPSAGHSPHCQSPQLVAEHIRTLLNSRDR